MEPLKGLKKDKDMIVVRNITVASHRQYIGQGKNACKELSQEAIGDIQTINEDISQYNNDIRAE